MVNRESSHPSTQLIFVLGGASSGKSDYALKICGSTTPRAFLATGEPLDGEMRRKIRAHQKARGPQWETIDVPIAVAEWFEQEGHRYETVLLDCVTLWLSNLQREGVQPRQIPARTQTLLRTIRRAPCRVVIVSNELGLGLVPGDPESRRFRTVAGRVNQLIAAAADEVHVVISGLPLRLK